MTRKTILSIDRYPSPKELYEELMKSPGYPYKSNMDFYLARDRALVALMYLAACRISEAIQLKRSQFKPKRYFILVEAMLLSKRKPGKVKYREAKLPLRGKRKPFTDLVIHYLELHKVEYPNEDRLFPWSLEKKVYVNRKRLDKKGNHIISVRLVGTHRAWEIIKVLLPNITDHWLRAFGEDFLYDEWDHDILAVSDYTKQDARTLQNYIRKRYEKYQAV